MEDNKYVYVVEFENGMKWDALYYLHNIGNYIFQDLETAKDWIERYGHENDALGEDEINPKHYQERDINDYKFFTSDETVAIFTKKNSSSDEFTAKIYQRELIKMPLTAEIREGTILRYGNLYVEDLVGFKDEEIMNVVLTEDRDKAVPFFDKGWMKIDVKQRLIDSGVGYTEEPVQIKRDIMREEKMM